MLCLRDTSGSFAICCRNCTGFKRPSTQEDLHLRVIKQLPTVLITKAKAMFSEHAKNYHRGRAADIDTSTEEQAVTKHCQNKMSMNWAQFLNSMLENKYINVTFCHGKGSIFA